MTQPLRDFDSWKTSLRNFEWIRDVAPGATDFDLVIERNGHFLVLEGKTWQPDGVHVPLGQHIAFTALAPLDAFTVVLVGETGDPQDPYRTVPYELFVPYSHGSHVVFPAGVFERASEDDMRQLVRRWIWSVRRV